jgi:hypothetical protein
MHPRIGRGSQPINGKTRHPSRVSIRSILVSQPPSAVFLIFVAQALLPVLLSFSRLQIKYETTLPLFPAIATKICGPLHEWLVFYGHVHDAPIFELRPRSSAFWMEEVDLGFVLLQRILQIKLHQLYPRMEHTDIVCGRFR